MGASIHYEGDDSGPTIMAAATTWVKAAGLSPWAVEVTFTSEPDSEHDGSDETVEGKLLDALVAWDALIVEPYDFDAERATGPTRFIKADRVKELRSF